MLSLALPRNGALSNNEGGGRRGRRRPPRARRSPELMPSQPHWINVAMSGRQWPHIEPFPANWGTPRWYYWIEKPGEPGWWWCRFLATKPARKPAEVSGSRRKPAEASGSRGSQRKSEVRGLSSGSRGSQRKSRKPAEVGRSRHAARIGYAGSGPTTSTRTPTRTSGVGEILMSI